ncbi:MULTISPECIES: chemotaxis protein CheW [unclassified Janthinobacterium]|uniref:chemotaxis protein CheW n=1 Tax=unclassified Janthinobacterium TaxID=2610881 RepID=UPI0025B2D752|nr:MULTISPECIES: chemotaxis protein CheW [unclassified Janthinobacterium]MDN2670128.1 chemotaxis protein CheW [Janthinobacterium sp. SUN026]MDN2704812.1 chemotaxis protein CheW [Janthinobacterium sp. SUN100]MDO8068439.1 chemotaxis protein CheW [Janthinobacterium sp. SUN206]
MQTMPGHGVSTAAYPSAAMPSFETGARQGRLRQYQLQLIERIQAARSGALAARKELGVMLGGRPCLLDLTQLGEIVIAAGVQIQGVPLAQDWYLGLAAMRGRLTGVVDLARYMGEAACAPGNHCRIITFSPRLGLNCALLVERVLGLRQLRAMQHVQDTAQGVLPSWAAQALRDSEGQQWLRLDLAQLAQSARFLDAGFDGLPDHKDIC